MPSLHRFNKDENDSDYIYVNTLLSSILFVMCITSAPTYLHSIRSFYLIFKKGQPFYTLLLFVLVASFFNLTLAAVDGLGFWMKIKPCVLFGCFRTTLLIISSLLVAFVCMSRCIAVSYLNFYKKLNKTMVLTMISGIMLVISIVIPVFFYKLGHINFKYIGPPSHIGCSPIVTSDNKRTYISFVIFFVFTCDFILLIVFLIVSRRLNYPSLRPCMKRLKASARKVSLIVTMLYLVLHLPLVIVYTVFSFSPTSVVQIGSPVGKLLLDFMLRFLSYLYSAILPTIIVKTGSTNEETLSAAKQSVIDGNFNKS